MKQKVIKIAISILSVIIFANCRDEVLQNGKVPIIASPEALYGQLFYDVQKNNKIFNDSKTFVDCIPKGDINKIREQYTKLENKSTENISQFINHHFYLPSANTDYTADSASIKNHITKLWEILKRPADVSRSGTLVPLPYPYIIPGGRFREIYYWDSYFTMLGLQQDRQIETIQNMVDNFAYLIDQYGFIPNGNRTYYLSRSQPPFFSMMVSLLADIKGETIYSKYLKQLEREYSFWMYGHRKVNDKYPTCNHVVKLAGGEILNRYWDEMDTPRPESYFEDIKTANEAVLKERNIKQQNIYRNLRAAAESGWDFSSRWLTADSLNIYRLYTIHTTDIIPVDLNCLLYNLESTISKAYRLNNNSSKADEYSLKSELRKSAILKYCWNNGDRFFMDFDFTNNRQTNVYSLAGVFPLFFNLVDQEYAYLIAEKIQRSFLKEGGVVSSLNNTGQQWDAPNGWAPLQWITIKGLKNYGFYNLANEIKKRWLHLNNDVYSLTYKLLEKYNVEDLSKKSGGGEYPTQDGFGWTNAIYQKLSGDEMKHGYGIQSQTKLKKK